MVHRIKRRTRRNEEVALFWQAGTVARVVQCALWLEEYSCVRTYVTIMYWLAGQGLNKFMHSMCKANRKKKSNENQNGIDYYCTIVLVIV